MQKGGTWFFRKNGLPVVRLFPEVGQAVSCRSGVTQARTSLAGTMPLGVPARSLWVRGMGHSSSDSIFLHALPSHVHPSTFSPINRTSERHKPPRPQDIITNCYSRLHTQHYSQYGFNGPDRLLDTYPGDSVCRQCCGRFCGDCWSRTSKDVEVESSA